MQDAPTLSMEVFTSQRRSDGFGRWKASSPIVGTSSERQSLSSARPSFSGLHAFNSIRKRDACLSVRSVFLHLHRLKFYRAVRPMYGEIDPPILRIEECTASQLLSRQLFPAVLLLRTYLATIVFTLFPSAA